MPLATVYFGCFYRLQDLMANVFGLGEKQHTDNRKTALKTSNSSLRYAEIFTNFGSQTARKMGTSNLATLCKFLRALLPAFAHGVYQTRVNQTLSNGWGYSGLQNIVEKFGVLQ